ncbi:hypothetical protein E4U41_006457, partial [Claviceps citrina]
MAPPAEDSPKPGGGGGRPIKEHQDGIIINLDGSPEPTSPSEHPPPNSHDGDRADPQQAQAQGQAQVQLTEEDSRRICRKTDRVILAILVWVYFLQILDKSVLGYGATYGLGRDTGLTGNQYSLVGSAAPIAQLAWQPFSSVLI